MTLKFLARDYVETAEGYCFAVVANELEDNRVLSMLRYRRDGNKWQKLSTDAAWQLLRDEHPELIFRSPLRDVEVHGVPLERVAQHHSTIERASQVLQVDDPSGLERIAKTVLSELVARGVSRESIGISGSLLLGAHQADSDVDLVIRNRADFRVARDVFRRLQERHRPSAALWKAAFEKRDSDLSFEQYLWHEQRKFNKLWIDGTKIDLGFVEDVSADPPTKSKKLRRVHVMARVIDDAEAFDHPSCWRIESVQPTRDHASEVICWTATYTGQAFVGEQIEVCGWLEEFENGRRQIVVGSSREATGEFIRVVCDSQFDFH